MMDPRAAAFIREHCERAVSDVDSLRALRDTAVLVTGGTGFVGRWVAETVAMLNDRFAFGIHLYLLAREVEAFRATAPMLATRSDLSLIRADVAHPINIPSDVEYIIHAAATTDGRLHASDPAAVTRTIVNGTQSLFESATRLRGVRRILHISSGNVYGAPVDEAGRVSETDYGGLDCRSLSSVYAESKRYAETLCTIYRTQLRLPILTARPFAFIGPFQRLDLPWAANSFFRDALAGQPIRLLGDGSSVRSYMFPSDMACWMLTILARGEIGGCYNVGSPEGASLIDLARRISDRCPRRPGIAARAGQDRQDRTSKLIPDIDKARSELNLSIGVGLDAAIDATMHWYTELFQ